MRSSFLVIAIVLFCPAAVALARAQASEAEPAAQPGMRIPMDPTGTPFVIDDEDPENSVPSPMEAIQRPLQMGYFVMIIAERAEAASKAGNHGAALKYYKALVKAAPDRATGYSRACAEYEALGDRISAIATCQKALTKAGAKVDDYVRFVHLYLKKEEPLDAKEIAELDAVIEHLETELATGEQVGEKGNPQAARLIANQLKCQLGARLGDVARLEGCTAELKKAAAKDPKTIAFALALALAKRDVDGAEQAVNAASQAGMPAKALAQMQQQVVALREDTSLWRKLLHDDSVWFVLGLVVVAALLAVVAWRQRQALRPA